MKLLIPPAGLTSHSSIEWTVMLYLSAFILLHFLVSAHTYTLVAFTFGLLMISTVSYER